MRIRLSWILAVALAGVIAVSTSAWENHSPMVAELLFVLATLLVVVAVAGRLWCSLYIAGQKTQTLVTAGPYSISRNPLYLFSFMGAIGVGLASETLTIPALVAVAFAVYYPYVILKEERVLQGLYGEQFQQYRARVPRFFPSLAGLSEPATYVSKPIEFRRHLFDVVWFGWLLGIIELVEALHHGDYLPTFVSLY
jgi:protein-S-isoprenylcysteine O-methyltransferase Ste14